MTDEQRERLIEAWRVILELDKDSGRATIAMRQLRQLISERTPRRVAEMERERGLRAP